MTDEMRIGPAGREDDLTRTLRAIYATPDDPAYWAGLEARILARIAADGDAWYQAYHGWLRQGLAAAAVLVAAALFALGQLQDATMRSAVHSVIETPRTLAHQMVTETTELSDREAVLELVTAP